MAFGEIDIYPIVVLPDIVNKAQLFRRDAGLKMLCVMQDESQARLILFVHQFPN